MHVRELLVLHGFMNRLGVQLSNTLLWLPPDNPERTLRRHMPYFLGDSGIC